MANEILLAEDSDYDEQLFKLVLKKSRVENPVIVVHDGTEAISCLEGSGDFAGRERPSIFCLDLKLPGLDGFGVLKWLEENPAIKEDLLIIVITEFSSAQNKRQALQLGAQTILSKPLRQAEVENLINEFPDYWIHPLNRAKGK